MSPQRIYNVRCMPSYTRSNIYVYSNINLHIIYFIGVLSAWRFWAVLGCTVVNSFRVTLKYKKRFEIIVPQVKAPIRWLLHQSNVVTYFSFFLFQIFFCWLKYFWRNRTIIYGQARRTFLEYAGYRPTIEYYFLLISLKRSLGGMKRRAHF